MNNQHTDDDTEPCGRCHETGEVWQQHQVDGHTRPIRVTCPRCKGTGRATTE